MNSVQTNELSTNELSTNEQVQMNSVQISSTCMNVVMVNVKNGWCYGEWRVMNEDDGLIWWRAVIPCVTKIHYILVFFIKQSLLVLFDFICRISYFSWQEFYALILFLQLYFCKTFIILINWIINSFVLLKRASVSKRAVTYWPDWWMICKYCFVHDQSWQ